jgi:hypothetical protein
MHVAWKRDDLSKGLGHGVEVQLKLGDDQARTIGFIDGYSWLHDKDPDVLIYLDNHLQDLPSTLTTELRLAILLFLTDKKRQQSNVSIHGFRFGFNA